MRRLRFSILLAAVIAGLALLAVLGMASVGYGLLRRLANEDALARVTMASGEGATALDRLALDAARTAEQLADRHAATATVAELADHARGDLDRFCAANGLTACVLVADGRLLAQSGSTSPTLDPAFPPELTAALPPVPRLPGAPDDEQPARTVVGHGRRGELWLIGDAPVAAAAGRSARTGLALTPGTMETLTRERDMDLRLIERGAEPPEGEPRARLRERAFQNGAALAERLGGDRRFVAVRPLSGALAALALEASLPTGGVRDALAVFVRRLTILALGIGSAAAACGLLLGRRLAEPVARLTGAAARIGAGDLATPVDREAGAELGALAEELDTMRGRLRQQTAELGRQQAESAAVLTGIAEGVFSVDRDRRVRYLNPQAAALLGIAPAAAVGRFCGDVLRPTAHGGVRPCEEHCPIVHARSRGSAHAVEQLELADGSRRSVVLTSSPPAAHLQFQVMRDETESEAARRLRDGLLANISHEFKTPLSAQLASLELLADRLATHDDAPTHDLVRALERGTLRLTQLVDNLLESARIEAGSLSIRRRPVALDEVVEEAVEWTAPLLAQRRQRLAVDLPFPLPAIEGDAPRLVQVLVNLLANANKFAPADSVVRIGGAVSVDAVSLFVEDDGPGLPEMAGRSLFGRFVRSTDDHEPEQSGMGLGLWIAQSIVERHGGAIDSARVGERTRVSLRLPRRLATAGVATGAEGGAS